MSTIFYLQYLQMEHDRNFHNDIYSLRPHDKVKHLTLHVVKYMGKLAVTRTQDEEALKRILTDSLIGWVKSMVVAGSIPLTVIG